jgi:hypothetical protein
MNASIKNLLISMLVVLSAGIGISFLFTPVEMFHFINPLAMALGLVILIVYSGGWIDAWRNRFQNITPAHFLTFGVTLNWLGLIFRLGRWYFTNEHPTGHPEAFWIYNLGLWISIWAGVFLIGAAQLVTNAYKTSTLIVVFLAIFAFLVWIDYTHILVF